MIEEVNIHGYFLTPQLFNGCSITKTFVLNDGRKDVAQIVVHEDFCEVNLFRDGKLERKKFSSTNARNYIPQVHETQRYDFVEFVKEIINDYVIHIVKHIV